MNFSLTEAALLLLVVSALVWLLASLSQSRSKDKAALRRVETNWMRYFGRPARSR